MTKLNAWMMVPGVVKMIMLLVLLPRISFIWKCPRNYMRLKLKDVHISSVYNSVSNSPKLETTQKPFNISD